MISLEFDSDSQTLIPFAVFVLLNQSLKTGFNQLP
jgi:hypothetical protein